MIQRTSGSQYAIIRDESAAGDVVAVFGDIDFGIAPELQEAVMASLEHHGTVTIDLAQCRYMGAAVVTVLVRAKAAFGNRLGIVAPHGSVALRLLTLVGLEQRFRFVESQLVRPIVARDARNNGFIIRASRRPERQVRALRLVAD